MKEIIFDTVAYLVIIVSIVYLVLLMSSGMESVESALQALSMTMIISVFLASAFYQLLKKK